MEKTGDDRYSLLLADFGITGFADLSTTLNVNNAKGTFRWMAPEVIDPPEGRQSTPTASSDTYSFAMTCVEVRLLV